MPKQRSIIFFETMNRSCRVQHHPAFRSSGIQPKVFSFLLCISRLNVLGPVVIAGPVSSDSGPSHVTPSTRPSSPLSSLTPSPPHPTRRSKRLEQVQRGDEVITASDGKRVHGVKRRNEKSSAEDRADEAPEQEEDTEDTPRQGEEEKDRQSLSGNGSDNLSLRARKLRLIMGTEGGRKKGPFPHISIMEPDLVSDYQIITIHAIHEFRYQDFGKDDVSEYPAPKVSCQTYRLDIFLFILFRSSRRE
jgi:hypothetical protein